MTSTVQQDPTRRQPTRRQRTGYVVSVVVALSNVPGAFVPSGDGSSQEGPPLAVLVVSAVLGVVAAVALVRGWRSGNRAWLRGGVVVLAVLAVLALPGVLVTGIPAWVRVGAGVYVLATVAGLALMFGRPRPSELPA